MKALMRHKYGSPAVLHVEEIQKPTPRDDEVLVKIEAASVNPLDWHFLRGEPRFARLTLGLFRPKAKVLGADISGRVEAVGNDVKNFQAGDEVFGSLFGGRLGGFAEYVCTGEEGIAQKPANMGHDQAAAVPTAAVTALQALRKRGEIRPGQTVLVNGASGGVGTFAVQIAKHLGAEVTGVCSTKNIEMVRSIGAGHVIDYTQEEFTRTGAGYDLIIDAVGNRSVRDLKRALSAHGACVIVGFSSFGLLLQGAILGPAMSRRHGRRLGLMGTVKVTAEDLESMSQLLSTGAVKPVIHERYSLEDAPDAVRQLELGHVPGKLVITM